MKSAADRYEANKKLVGILYNLVDTYPNLRFSQLLLVAKFVNDKEDEFYLESEELLARVNEALKMLQQNEDFRNM